MASANSPNPRVCKRQEGACRSLQYTLGQPSPDVHCPKLEMVGAAARAPNAKANKGKVDKRIVWKQNLIAGVCEKWPNNRKACSFYTVSFPGGLPRHCLRTTSREQLSSLQSRLRLSSTDFLSLFSIRAWVSASHFRKAVGNAACVPTTVPSLSRCLPSLRSCS